MLVHSHAANRLKAISRVDRRQGSCQRIRVLFQGQAITSSTLGVDQRVGAQLAADAANQDVQGVGVRVQVACVDVLGDVGAADDLARTLDEVREDALLLGREGQVAFIELEAVGDGVLAQGAHGDDGGGTSLVAAMQHPQSGDDLVFEEGLGEVVVRTDLEGIELVAPA